MQQYLYIHCQYKWLKSWDTENKCKYSPIKLITDLMLITIKS